VKIYQGGAVERWQCCARWLYTVATALCCPDPTDSDKTKASKRMSGGDGGTSMLLNSQYYVCYLHFASRCLWLVSTGSTFKLFGSSCYSIPGSCSTDPVGLLL